MSFDSDSGRRLSQMPSAKVPSPPSYPKCHPSSMKKAFLSRAGRDRHLGYGHGRGWGESVAMQQERGG